MCMIQVLIGKDGVLVTIQVKILQPEKLQAYIDGHAPSLEQYGGKTNLSRYGTRKRRRRNSVW